MYQIFHFRTLVTRAAQPRRFEYVRLQQFGEPEEHRVCHTKGLLVITVLSNVKIDALPLMQPSGCIWTWMRQVLAQSKTYARKLPNFYKPSRRLVSLRFFLLEGEGGLPPRP